MYTASNISTPELIEQSLKEMQSFIEAHYDADNPTAVVERANVLESYMALSGKLLADAEYNYNKLLNGVFIKSIKESAGMNMSTSTLNKYIETLCYDLKYQMTWADRINRAATHQIDFSRTIISKLKEEIRQLQSR